MEASADKRSRESPDTTTKPDGKSLKTSEAASPSPARQDMSDPCIPDICMSRVSDGQDANVRVPANRRLANDALEARLLIRQMRKRVPAWRLTMCIEALNARPMNVARIAKVTEILFADNEKVAVAAQCLADLSRESESNNQSTEHVGATSVASDEAEKESMNVEQASHEPENEPEGAAESFRTQTAETSTADECATAQSSIQLTSSTATANQVATALTGMTPPDAVDPCQSVEKQQDSTVTSESCVQKGSDHSWVIRFLKGDHDLLWPSEPVSSVGYGYF